MTNSSDSSQFINLPPRAIDVTGRRFGRLVAVGPVRRDKAKQIVWLCRCDCGKVIERRVSKLTEGSTRSCGCLRTESMAAPKTHGMTHTHEYKAWVGMNHRCIDPAKKTYFGVVSVCDGWKNSFEPFYEHIGPSPSRKHQLDRIDGTKGYQPGNVRWATVKEQQRNRKSNRLLTWNGETRCVTEWAEILGIGKTTIRERLVAGWSVADALSTPPRSRTRWRRG